MGIDLSGVIYFLVGVGCFALCAAVAFLYVLAKFPLARRVTAGIGFAALAIVWALVVGKTFSVEGPRVRQPERWADCRTDHYPLVSSQDVQIRTEQLDAAGLPRPGYLAPGEGTLSLTIYPLDGGWLTDWFVEDRGLLLVRFARRPSEGEPLEVAQQRWFEDDVSPVVLSGGWVHTHSYRDYAILGPDLATRVSGSGGIGDDGWVPDGSGGAWFVTHSIASVGPPEPPVVQHFEPPSTVTPLPIELEDIIRLVPMTGGLCAEHYDGWTLIETDVDPPRVRAIGTLEQWRDLHEESAGALLLATLGTVALALFLFVVFLRVRGLRALDRIEGDVVFAGVDETFTPVDGEARDVAAVPRRYGEPFTGPAVLLVRPPPKQRDVGYRESAGPTAPVAVAIVCGDPSETDTILSAALKTALTAGGLVAAFALVPALLYVLSAIS